MNNWNNETRIDITILHCIINWHIIMSDIQRSDCFYRIFLVLSMSIILHYILNSKSLTSCKNSLKTGYYSRDTTQRKKLKNVRPSDHQKLPKWFQLGQAVITSDPLELQEIIIYQNFELCKSWRMNMFMRA